MMVRPFTLFCAILASVAGMVLYAQKHKTTILDHEIAKIVSETNIIKNNTAMLRTQWTLLNQPDRLKDLSTRFLPKLHPLEPTQFIKMASIIDVLPAPKIEAPKDKDNNTDVTAQTLASNNDVTDTSDVPIMITDQKQVIMPKHVTKPTVKPVIKKPNINNDQNIVAAQATPVTTPHVNTPKKAVAKPVAVASTTNTVAMKPEYVENVSYNIQGSSKKTNKFAKTKTKIATNNDSDSSLLPPKKHVAAIKVARYEPQKNKYTHSALDNGADEALPAPVPFSR